MRGMSNKISEGGNNTGQCDSSEGANTPQEKTTNSVGDGGLNTGVVSNYNMFPCKNPKVTLCHSEHTRQPSFSKFLGEAIYGSNNSF